MKRRDFLGMAAYCALIGSAQAVAPVAEPKDPFDKVGPFAGDAKNVFEFFMFTCNFCQQHHAAINSWGRSIPSPVRFDPIPIIVDRQSFDAARAYYAVRYTSPDRVADFLNAALSASAQGQTNMATPALLQSVGVNERKVEQAWGNPNVKAALERAMTITARYNIKATPSLGIGGKYVIHADHTGGDYRLLLQIASGFVSRILEASNG